MPLKSFVVDAKKTNAIIDKLQLNQKGSEDGIIDISDGQAVPKEELEKIKNSNKSSLPSSAKQRAIPSNKDFTSFEREYIKRSEDRRPIGNNSSGQKVDERHNNIITNIIQDSNTKTRGRTTWDCCKHKKETDGKIYCTEFHSFCGKEKCKRATE
ncbi:MAG: hypothetical protein HON47_04360 [Candidatus Diapherotrites archaeon]|jgi:hypothetical protein|uniref:Uncharacterized protein n=1 Tax=Candidatus Iainarchaeum sp. TaxID=3101447 RepID=A0A8T5GFW6_9ARCH|nr:hypothetical protein [Candidatus Diapherotrites archaeon]MBT7240900.1 hypothetical protein [Candidatus Diapherotrites archaeon]